FLFSFFFTRTATTELSTLSLHDALPICGRGMNGHCLGDNPAQRLQPFVFGLINFVVLRHEQPNELAAEFGKWHAQLSERVGETRSEEHTSELQSRGHLVCRLLLEKKKKK